MVQINAPQQQFRPQPWYMHMREGEDIESTLTGSTEHCDTEGATHYPLTQNSRATHGHIQNMNKPVWQHTTRCGWVGQANANG